MHLSLHWLHYTLTRNPCMHRTRFLCSILLFFAALLGGCAPRPNAPAVYNAKGHALLLGRADCIIPGWFDDSKTGVRLRLYRLNRDGTKTFMANITGEYTAIPVESGIYGIDKDLFDYKPGLIYKTVGYSYKGTPNYTTLFLEDIWNKPFWEQVPLALAAAPDCFGVMRVEAGEVIYFGDLTLDMVTTRNTPMFVVARNKSMAAQALRQKHPGKEGLIIEKEWIGQAFFLGQIRESRYQSKK